MTIEHHEPPGDKHSTIEIAGIDLNFQDLIPRPARPQVASLPSSQDSTPTSVRMSSSGAMTAILRNSAIRRKPTCVTALGSSSRSPTAPTASPSKANPSTGPQMKSPVPSSASWAASLQSVACISSALTNPIACLVTMMSSRSRRTVSSSSAAASRRPGN